MLLQSLAINVGIGQIKIAHNIVVVVTSPVATKVLYNGRIQFDSYFKGGMSHCRT